MIAPDPDTQTDFSDESHDCAEELPLGQARRNGVFSYGERVQLTDYKGRMYTFELVEKGQV